jgi:glycosyltransferase involved in cell wall biosynthesis
LQIKIPLVTIACITYNQENYVRQTLDGFLMQKVNFDYEIVIHDDASTDNTQAILKEYHEKHPDKIKLILRTENLYSIGVTKIFYHQIVKHSKAKYIATCEGDDYWTDEHKLQKQVDFLEKNDDFNFSVGRVNHYYQNTGELKLREEFSELFTKSFLTIKDYLKSFFSQTSTYVFRREGYEMPQYCNYFHGEDILLVAIATKHGKIKFHDEVFSVYRIHGDGVTQKKYNWKMHYLDIYNYTEAIHTILDKKYKALIASIKLRLWLDYKLKVSSNPVTRFIYRGLSMINHTIKRRLL